MRGKSKTFCIFLVLAAMPAFAGLTGTLSTPDGSGLVSGGGWTPENGGVSISWQVIKISEDTWNYTYTFTGQSGDEAVPHVSHFIIGVSDDLTFDKLSNPAGDFGDWELDWFGPAPSNPGYPGSGPVYGLKIEMGGNQLQVSFDSSRMPMWGDIYAKGGSTSYAYNADFGSDTANLHDYSETAVDAAGNPLFKVLVPNHAPEPMTLLLLGLGSVGFLFKRR